METQRMTEIATEPTSNEIWCQKKRNQYLNDLKSHFHLVKTFSVEHKKHLDRMSVLSPKLKVIESGCNRLYRSPYTKELLWKVKGEILNSVDVIVSKINKNLQQLSLSFNSLRQSQEEFIISSKAIDSDNRSRLCTGSATEKPLLYYVDHSFDIMYGLYIYEQTNQFNKLHLDVRDTDSITKFSIVVSISQTLHDLIIDVLLNSFFVDKMEKVRNKS